MPSTIGEQERECSLLKLKDLIKGNDLIVAPVVFNPIMARMAQEAGFKAIYLSGGTLGWVKCVTEANLTLPEMAEVAVDMRAACKLPIVLDAGGGWGDPGACPPHHRAGGSRRVPGDRNRGPIATEAGGASYRHRSSGADRVLRCETEGGAD